MIDAVTKALAEILILWLVGGMVILGDATNAVSCTSGRAQRPATGLPATTTHNRSF
jgi:hypothetical protein